MMYKLQLLALNLLITVSLYAQNRLISPFLGDTSPNQATTNYLMQQPGTINVNYINLDLSLLGTTTNLQITFDNQNYTVNNDSIAQRGYQNYSWFGSNSNGDGYIIISVLGNDVQGIIRKGIESYKIVTSSVGFRKAVVKIDQSQYPLEYCVFSNTNNKQNLNDHQKNGTGYLKNILDTGCPIRVLVMYTSAAEMDITSDGTTTGNIINEICNTVEEMNVTFNLSKITNYPAVEIALIQKWNYTENTDITIDLNNFKNDNYVKTLRETYDADFCMLIAEDSDFYDGCGVADDLEATYATAFSVTANNCMKTNFTFAHELGHLLGAHHNVSSAGPTPKAYGHGYIYFPGLWRTIMSYNAPPCGNTYFVDYCVRIGSWSNPNVDHPTDMVPTGTASTEDNARVCREYNNNLAQLEQPEDNLILTNSNYSTNTNMATNLEVKESISTSGIVTINNGVNISMKAEQRITLNSGFKSRANARVHISNEQFEDCP